MDKLRERVNTTFYTRYFYSYVIVNIEDGSRIVFYRQKRGSLWINNFNEAAKWLNEQENDRLNRENTGRPNTKWVFVRFLDVDVTRVVLDRQPLLVADPD